MSTWPKNTPYMSDLWFTANPPRSTEKDEFSSASMVSSSSRVSSDGAAAPRGVNPIVGIEAIMDPIAARLPEHFASLWSFFIALAYTLKPHR